MDRRYLRKSYFDVSKEEDIDTLKKALMIWKRKHKKKTMTTSIYWQVPTEGAQRHNYQRINLQKLAPAEIKPMPETTAYYNEYRYKATYQSILSHIKDEYDYARYLARKEAFDVLVAENSN